MLPEFSYLRQLGLLNALAAVLCGIAHTTHAEPITIRIGVRADAAPFSSAFTQPHIYDARPCPSSDGTVDTGMTYRGYSVDLCRDFMGALKTKSSRPIQYCFKPVATHSNGQAPNRFEALATGEIDMLCGATTATLNVQSRFRASLMTFLSTSSFLYNPSSVDMKVEEQLPLRVGVLADTTSDGRKNPDAAAQQAEVRAALSGIGQDAPVTFNSHRDVAEMLCNANADNTGCHNATVEAEQRATEQNIPPDMGDTGGLLVVAPPDDCRYESRPVQQWLGFAWSCTGLDDYVAALWSGNEEKGDRARLASGETEVRRPDDDAGAAAGQPGNADGTAEKVAQNAVASDTPPAEDTAAQLAMDEAKLAPEVHFAQRRLNREIDVYVADRPILESILAQAKLDGTDAGIALHDSPIMSQPYAILFPSREVADASAVGQLLGIDLHLAFNQFLVQEIYAPGHEVALRQRLEKYFKTTRDRSFLNMIPVFARWPTGATFPP